jgi:8-oxo-dGTP pyrophosphatase MutT (NUDIX family)
VLRDFPLPADQQAHVHAWEQAPAEAAPPRAAATVLLVRDAAPPSAGVEVFLLRRQVSMAFAGGMYVFPGGGVDPRDAEDDVAWAGPSAQVWGARLGAASAAQARALVCAAVRETFEECGVLLAAEAPDGPVVDVSGAGWEAERQALLARETALSDLLRRRRLVLRSDLLRAWAHWTTPVHEPRRYDTRFFLAVLPGGQDARHVDDGEADESGWWPAAEVLRRSRTGEIAMLPPTLVTVEEIAAAADVAALWSAQRTVREVMPVLRREGSRYVLTADLP